MKKIVYLLILLLVACNSDEKDIQLHDDTPLKLIYQQPATEWIEALPVGNGRIGAMVYGKPDQERILINEESLFAGLPINDNNPNALESLPRIRQLLFAGENMKAKALAQKTLLATPPRLRSYQSLMDVQITYDSGNVQNYERTLNLITGIASAEYVRNGSKFSQQVFASAPDDVIIIKITSENKAGFDLNLYRQKDVKIQVLQDQILLQGQIIDEFDSARGSGGAHMRFAGMLKVATNGKLTATDRLLVKDATETIIYLTGATDHDFEKLDFNRNIDPLQLAKAKIETAKSKGYAVILNDHMQEHSEMMQRFEIYLGGADSLNNIATDIRLERVQQGIKDPGLVALYTQYGRYLLMGSSRKPGRLPANLQGIWSKGIEAPWNADYHVNINLQMNYWPAEVGNLSETAIPLINFIDRYRTPGGKTAREMYGTEGWTMHHNTTVFGRTGLHDGIQWGTFPMGGPWMTFPIWRHFEYNQDTNFLREEAWPILKGSCDFILGFLVKSPERYLVTSPSYSPENTFINPKTGQEVRLTYGPTIDTQIITELFNYTIKAAEILNKSETYRQKLEATLKQLPPVKIGADGTIQEWIEDYEEAEPGHRHISHLLGLHPGTQIIAADSAMFAAAAKTIEKRLANGGGHTGWSRAWIINFYARLLNAEKAYENVQALLAKSTLPNLFDTHPPFQIDGNFGGAAGVMEMLLQSHAGEIHLLPALPKQWENGYVKGIKARGGYEVDIFWQDGELTKALIHGVAGKKSTVRYQEKVKNPSVGKDETIKLSAKDFIN